MSDGTEKRFCEFFAGIGLVRLGLERAGWRCCYANDNDPKKQQLYEARFGSNHFHLGDVFDISDVLAQIPANVTLATASFPCVDLSLAGHWRGIDGCHSSAVFGFLQCISGMGHPPLLLLENVVGLLTSKEGKDFARLVQLLAEEGYWLDAFRLDARHFVPQSRPRVFLVGMHESAMNRCPYPRSDEAFRLGDDGWEDAIRENQELRPRRLVDLVLSTNLTTGWFCSVRKTPIWNIPRLSELIDLGEDEDWWNEEQVTKHCEMMTDRHRVLVDQLRFENEPVVGTIYRRKRHGMTRAEVRFDGIAGCLRTPRGGSPSSRCCGTTASAAGGGPPPRGLG